MLVCIQAAGKVMPLAASLFTLSWTHSVEKTSWQETWLVTERGLVIQEARVQGSGAGMEPGDGARSDGHWWVWTPKTAPLQELILASSGATGTGWTVCDKDGCREVGIEAERPIILRPCKSARQ